MANKPNDPIVDYANQSVILDTVLVEKTSNKLGNYDPVEPGAPYPKSTHSAAQVALFEGNEFLGQKASDDEEWMRRYFAKPPSTQNIANWEEGYSSESNDHPIFQRRYLEKRDSYTPRTKLSALPGLYRINVTATGSGYTAPPTITFSGGTGSGATAIAVLNNSGGIAKITLKSEGTYTVVPAVVITAVGAGAGATATASIQPADCVLVKEAVTDNAPEPYRSLYIVATRIYETLPGPAITTTRLDEDGIGVTVARQRMVVASIATNEALSASDTVWTRSFKGAGDAIVADQITEVRSLPGNILTAKFYDPVSDTIISETRRLVAVTTADPTIASLYTDFRAQPNGSQTKWHIERTYPADVTSKTIVEHEGDNFTYPALMSGVSTATLTKVNGEVIFKLTKVIESERPLEITRKVTKTFTTTQPTDATILSGLYPIRPVRHGYNGILFDLVTGPVICDANGGLTATTGSGDPVWGALVETYAWSASTPNYTNYIAERTAGNWKMVSPRKSQKLAAGLWMLVMVEIPIL